MSEGIVTQHETICFICGRRAEAEERMSKMIGQLAWEREWLLKNTVTINSKGQMAKVEGNVVRSQFMKRYGRSYL